MATVRAEMEVVNQEREAWQDGGRERMEGGERLWREGVGGLVRVLVGGRG